MRRQDIIRQAGRTDDAQAVRRQAVDMEMDGNGYVWLAVSEFYDSSFADWQGLLLFNPSQAASAESQAKSYKYKVDWPSMTPGQQPTNISHRPSAASPSCR